MRQVHIVLGLIQQGDNYLLQFRNGDPKIGAAGFIGCFGGKIEPNETLQEAVVREVYEETTLESTLKDWQLIGEIDVEADNNLETVKVHATAFLCNVSSEVKAKEGVLVSIKCRDIPKRLESLTPGTKALFETYFKEQLWH